MIVVQLIGGLGNQMFQYAMAKAMSLEKKQKLFLDRRGFETYKLHDYGLRHFNLNQSFYREPHKIIRKIRDFVYPSIFYKEDQFNLDPKVFELKGNLIFLEGYFQTQKYFYKWENEIRKDFEVVSSLKQETKDTIDAMQNVESVSIHIRRGDYLLHQIHNTDKAEYYRKAMSYVENMIENPVYYVFSDDMPWVKQNFKTNFKTVYIDFNDVSSNYEDLKLISSCKHNIIANSSFSWWGAWLNNNPDKIVVAPKKWFNDESINTSDIIPDDWVKL